jgi:hypothetical protein
MCPPQDPPQDTPPAAAHGVTHGACLCGAVRFTLRLPTRWIAHCHCTLCQRAHGAAFVTWVSIDVQRFALEAQDDALAWCASSPQAERGFCRHCGSSLLFRSARWPGEVHVARANITGPLDRLPQMHGFYDTHVDWFTVNDGLPRKPDP